MRKYLEVAKTLFKAQIVYRFDVIMTALSTIGRVLFAWILWGVVFSGRETVGGFTYQAMLAYYVMSSFLSSIEMGSGVSGEVSARIRGGTFSKFMVVPTSPIWHFASQTFGAAAYYALFSVLAAAASALFFRVNIALPESALTAALAALMVPVGLTFMVFYHFFIGVLAFKFQDIGFFWHMQGSVIAFATGAVVPLTLLPESVQSVLRFFPFTYVTYAPAMLLTGRMGAAEGSLGLAVISLWAVFMYWAATRMYGRLRVKFDGVGI